MDRFLYPVTEKTFREYVKDIFTPIKRGECVTTIWVPMSGRRKHNKFLIENVGFFDRELSRPDKYLLVYVEPLDLTDESISSYMSLMAKSLIETCKKNKEVCGDLEKIDKSIFSDSTASYSSILESLKSFLKEITTKGVNVVFFVGEFDELTFSNKIFYNNLMSLWNNFNPMLHYVFLMRERVANQKNLQSWGELSEIILQNVVYIPTLSGQDDDFIIDQLKSEFLIKPNTHQLKIIKDICGGHPFLLKVAFRILADNYKKSLGIEEIRNLFYDNYELRWVVRRVFETRSEDEKIVLTKIALRQNFNKKEFREEVEFLTGMGLVKVINGELRPFNKLFSRTIQGFEKNKIVGGKEIGSEVSLDNETGAIIWKGRTVEEKFTRQEYVVFSEFLRSINKIVKREDVGRVLWGKEMYEKYSDWALDQLISKLRKKLNLMGIREKLVTIRGKGYKFIQED